MRSNYLKLFTLVDVGHAAELAVADLLGVAVVVDVAVGAGAAGPRGEIVRTERDICEEFVSSNK